MSEVNYIVILMTAGSIKEATKIADALVSQRLAACVNIIPQITSIYIWKQRKESSKEALLIAKTLAKNFNRIRQLVKRIHSYEVPEIIAIPIVKGDRDYLHWIEDICRD